MENRDNSTQYLQKHGVSRLKIQPGRLEMRATSKPRRESAAAALTSAPTPRSPYLTTVPITSTIASSARPPLPSSQSFRPFPQMTSIDPYSHTRRAPSLPSISNQLEYRAYGPAPTHHQRNATSPSPASTSLYPPVSNLDFHNNNTLHQPPATSSDRFLHPGYTVASHSSGSEPEPAALRASRSPSVPTSFDEILPETLQISHSRRPSSYNNSKTESVRRLLSPKLRQTASFAAAPGPPMENVTPPRSDNDATSAKQRLSDEASGAGMRSRKKSGFSKFVTSMLGSPKPSIGAPVNPVHLTHVGVDNETGQFTVRDLEQNCLYLQHALHAWDINCPRFLCCDIPWLVLTFPCRVSLQNGNVLSRSKASARKNNKHIQRRF